MTGCGKYLAVLVYSLSLGVIAIAATPNTNDSFLDSLVRFSEQYQSPAMASPDSRSDSSELASKKSPKSPGGIKSKPKVAFKSRAPFTSPLSKKHVLNFQSSMSHRPFKGTKVVHSKFFFVPEQSTSGQAISGSELFKAGQQSRSTQSSERAGSSFETSLALHPVEHVLIDSSVLISTVCSHMRQDFVSEEPQTGKVTLVNVGVSSFKHVPEGTSTPVRGQFFPNAFGGSFVQSYGTRVVASIAYIGICVSLNLIFGAA